MHEVGIARGILETVAERFPEHASVRGITVRLGPFSGVEPEALRFAFDALRSELLSGCVELRLETPKAVGDCPDCGRDLPLPSPGPCCPHCRKTLSAIRGGDELTLVSVETADEETTHAVD
jgi:hydrogenase nickel incorporation protein HypA/HybF